MSRDNKPQLINKHDTYGTWEPRIEAAPAGGTAGLNFCFVVVKGTTAFSETRAALTVTDPLLHCATKQNETLQQIQFNFSESFVMGWN